MVLQHVTFLTSSTTNSNLPKSSLPEIAFVGRSNVGKSTLINALTHNSTLAKTSKTPGRTQQINFFKSDCFMLVDLPGYGYAKAPIAEVQKWHAFNLEYIKSRQQLRMLFILVDARIGIGNLDLELIKTLYEWGKSCQIIYTKSDKLNKTELKLLESVTQFNSEFYNLSDYAIVTSSKTGEGINKLQKVILTIIQKR